ncbi:MAG: PEGA domain-containing protein [Trueperaceae bacterium]|nr:PEGA domain-containing protein [Trueperaceae bacterium]
MTSLIPLLYDFALLGGVWVALLALIWLPLTRLPFWSRRFPRAWRSALGTFGVAALVVPAAGLLRTTEAPATPVVLPGSDPSDTRGYVLSIDSDPNGAAVFLESRRIGPTPIRWSVGEGGVVSYVVVADPRLFRPFVGQLNVEQDANIAVWMERRPDEIPEPAFPEDAKPLTLLSHGLEPPRVIRGQLYNRDRQSYLYAVVSFELFAADGSSRGVGYDLFYNVAAGEVLDVTVRLRDPDVTSYRVLDVVALNPQPGTN